MVNIGPFAVSMAEFQKLGCTNCGGHVGFRTMSCPGGIIWTCGDERCGQVNIILFGDIKRPSFSIGNIRPELRPHPRRYARV